MAQRTDIVHCVAGALNHRENIAKNAINVFFPNTIAANLFQVVRYFFYSFYIALLNLCPQLFILLKDVTCAEMSITSGKTVPKEEKQTEE